MSGEEFPHGTPAGYERGCRGIACANHRSETLMTCEQAQVRFAGDYAYRRAVLAGTATAEREVFAGEGRASARKPGATVLVHMPEVPVLPTPTFDVDAAREAEPVERPSSFEVFDKPKRRGGRQTKPITHGTRYGYVRGCRDRAECPAAVAGGESCKEAHNRYTREHKASKTGKPVAPARAEKVAGPKPVPVVIPAPIPVVIPEEAWEAAEAPLSARTYLTRGGERVTPEHPDAWDYVGAIDEEGHPIEEAPEPVAEVVQLPRREETSPAQPVLAGLREENAALKERVAFLELELDVAKAQIRDEQRRLVALVNELFREAS